MDQERDRVAALVRVDEDAVRVVDEVAGDVLDDGLRAATGGAVALGRDLVVVVLFGLVFESSSASSEVGVRRSDALRLRVGVAGGRRVRRASARVSALTFSASVSASVTAAGAGAAAAAGSSAAGFALRGLRRLGRGLGRRLLAGRVLVRVPHAGEVEDLRDLLGRLGTLSCSQCTRALGVER